MNTLTGRALDREVAEKVMGHKLSIDRDGIVTGAAKDIPRYRYLSALPAYSTRIEDAWLVVERMREQGWLVRVQEMPDGYPWLEDETDPRARVFKRAVCMLYWVSTKTFDDMRLYMRSPSAYGDTSAEAICRAALIAIEDGRV